MRKKLKNLLWIIPSVIIIVAFIFLFSSTRVQPHCGDGVCTEDEIEEGASFCDIDCIDECTSTQTGEGIDIEDDCSVGWDAVYIDLINQGVINPSHLSENQIIDFSNTKIRTLAKNLRQDTIKETAKEIARWTKENIYYDDTDTYYDCLGESASGVITRGSGVCSTMSKVNIALLRANGIPAYSVTGCWKFNENCQLFQTFYSDLFKKFIDIQVDETGYAPTLGYLHNWVVIPVYQDGVIETVLLESTSGTLYKNKCVNYREYYQDPTDRLACGLSQIDNNLEDCRNW